MKPSAPVRQQATQRVAVVQHACSNAYDDNLAQAETGIRAAAEQGAQLVLLQELFSGPYFCQTEETRFFDLAEAVPAGPTTQALAALAAELRIVIVGSVFERRAAGIYHNTAVVLERDGSLAGRYRKMHIPDDPAYYEKFYFTPGDGPCRPIATSVGRLGVLVCWDQWFPEAARLMALGGADYLLYPTAIGWDATDSQAEQQRQQQAWRLIQRSHAVANGLPVLSCNRVGFESQPQSETAGIQFWGASFVCGPQGEILAEAGAEAEVLVADVNPARSEQIRRIWPFLRDRRIDAYAPLARRYLDDD